jgi:hypothetical protein
MHLLKVGRNIRTVHHFLSHANVYDDHDLARLIILRRIPPRNAKSLGQPGRMDDSPQSWSRPAHP